MLELGFAGSHALERVLCIGAHCDDIEIGAGGTILRLREAYPDASFYWLTLSSSQQRAAEARASAERFLGSVERHTVDIQRFRNAYFPYIGADIKEYFEALKPELDPDLVLTHYSQDLHQDHRLTAELCYNTFRDHLIFEYEIPKYDGGLGSPSVFVPLSKRHLEAKVQHLLECYTSQHSHRWFSAETFTGLARLRGIECNAPQGYAEAFYCRKVVVSA